MIIRKIMLLMKNAEQLQPLMREVRGHGFMMKKTSTKIKVAGGCAT